MGDDDQRLTGTVHLEQEIEHGAGGRAVEVARRFVGPDDGGLADQGAGDGDSLLLTAGQFGGPVPVAAVEADFRQHLVGLAPRRLRLGSAEQERQLDVLGGRELSDEVEALEDEAHAAGPMVGATGVGHRRNVLAVDDDAALVDVVEPRQAVHQRGLAVARRSHHGDHLAGAEIDVDASECFDLDGPGSVRLAYPRALRMDTPSFLLNLCPQARAQGPDFGNVGSRDLSGPGRSQLQGRSGPCLHPDPRPGNLFRHLLVGGGDSDRRRPHGCEHQAPRAGGEPQSGPQHRHPEDQGEQALAEVPETGGSKADAQPTDHGAGAPEGDEQGSGERGARRFHEPVIGIKGFALDV